MPVDSGSDLISKRETGIRSCTKHLLRFNHLLIQDEIPWKAAAESHSLCDLEMIPYPHAVPVKSLADNTYYRRLVSGSGEGQNLTHAPKAHRHTKRRLEKYVEERDGPPIKAMGCRLSGAISSAEHSMMQGFSCPRLDANAWSVCLWRQLGVRLIRPLQP